MMRLLGVLGSTRYTAPGLALLVLSLLAAHLDPRMPGWVVLVPSSLLAVHLAAALMHHRAFRTQPGLLLFHGALLLVMVLTGIDQLVTFSARVELVQGHAFDAGDIEVVEAGPLHRVRWLEDVRFVQRSIRVEYAAGMVRRRTRSRVSIMQPGESRSMQFGDSRPLEAAGYRFYTTSNKGFSALLRFVPDSGSAHVGHVNFPSFPLNDWNQRNRWTTPQGESLALDLIVASGPDGSGDWRFDEASLQRVKALNVRTARHSATLSAGDGLRVDGGWISYEGAQLWMGYHVVYEPLLHLTLGVALVGALGLAWHVLRCPRLHDAVSEGAKVESGAANA